uniref:Glucosamine 6-phosphate N-acetyltransferase n=1 Tax=Lygus hesperus TaxID=30085 RepID=A0A146MBL6_LYGHE
MFFNLPGKTISTLSCHIQLLRHIRSLKMAENSSDYLFDVSVLTSLDTSEIERDLTLPSGATVLAPGAGLVLRPLSLSDYSKGYTDVLSQLTSVGDITEESFQETFKKMKSCENTYYITVIEDTNTGKVIGSGTLLVEQKIIHSCALRGRLEDIVVSDTYRGKQLGKLLVLLLTQLSKTLNCYKVSLDCKDHNRPFYEGVGYKRDEGNSNFMVIRYR